MDNDLNFKLNKISNKVLSIFIIISLVFLSLPLNAIAGTVSYLAVTIDDKSFTYSGSVVITDEWSNSNNPEKKQLHLNNSDVSLVYPNNYNDMTKLDNLGAEYTNSILVSSLNSAIYKVAGKNGISSVSELQKIAGYVSKSGRYTLDNGEQFTVKLGEKSGKVCLDFNFDIDGDGSKETLPNSSYLTITKDGESTSYIYKMPKYTSGNDNNKEITWELIIYRAKLFYEKDITAGNLMEKILKPNLLTKSITSFTSLVVTQLQNLLNLTPIQDLVFNEGLRDTTQYVYGVFPSAWQGTINLVFIIFQSIAWVSILLAIISLVFRKNLSSMTTSIRVDVMMDIQKIVFVGITLTLLFPIINIILKFGYLLTDVFSNMMDPSSKTHFYSSVPMYGNGFAAILVGVAYFVASITINILYIVRGIIVAVFISASPLFVVFMTLGDKYKRITMDSVRIFLSFVFTQAINALVLGFLMSIPFNSIKGIEALVFVYAMIPISEIIKELIFQKGGGETNKLANQVADKTTDGLKIASTLAMPFAYKGFNNIKNSFKDSKSGSNDKTNSLNSSSENTTNKTSAIKERNDFYKRKKPDSSYQESDYQYSNQPSNNFSKSEPKPNNQYSYNKPNKDYASSSNINSNNSINYDRPSIHNK